MSDAAESAQGTGAEAAVEPAPAARARQAEPPLEALPSRLYWANVNRPVLVGFLLTVGGLLAALLAMVVWNLSTVIVYVVLALFIALGLDPLVRWLEGRGMRRGWAIVAVSIAFALLVAGIGWLILRPVVAQVGDFIASLPSLIEAFQRSAAYAWITEHFSDQLDDAIDDAQSFVADPANLVAISGGVMRVGASIGTGISGVVAVVVLSLYFLASLSSMKRALVRLFPARSRESASSLVQEISRSVGGYLSGMVILAAMNAVVVFVLSTVLGMPFPLLLAVAAFCITLIPLVGSVLFWVAGTAVALLASDGVADAVVFGLVYLVYIQVEAYLLTPRVMHSTVAVPGSLVVIGALAGGTLLGLLGALVAIPVTASILLIVDRVLLPKQDAKT